MNVIKINVVGEPKTGKSTLISTILGDSLRKSNSQSPECFPIMNGLRHSQDFVLKIMLINGIKYRIQLWDCMAGYNISSAFSPLFIRNSSCCLVVALAHDLSTLDK